MTEARRVQDDDTVVHPTVLAPPTPPAPPAPMPPLLPGPMEPAESVAPEATAPAVDPYAAGAYADGADVDGAYTDDDYLLLQPQRTSRVTIALVAVLILLVGFFIGVQVQKTFGGFSRPAGQSAAASGAPSR